MDGDHDGAVGQAHVLHSLRTSGPTTKQTLLLGLVQACASHAAPASKGCGGDRPAL